MFCKVCFQMHVWNCDRGWHFWKRVVINQGTICGIWNFHFKKSVSITITFEERSGGIAGQYQNVKLKRPEDFMDSSQHHPCPLWFKQQVLWLLLLFHSALCNMQCSSLLLPLVLIRYLRGKVLFSSQDEHCYIILNSFSLLCHEQVMASY